MIEARDKRPGPPTTASKDINKIYLKNTLFKGYRSTSNNNNNC